ncbi:unnamed protein product [Urochloa decumbens]|uniref:VQ domain-containing protein n=1 Tax=Urochloa decumbens TaxID=240449 RepID=A0ABC8YDH3_9POAL
MSPTPPRQPGAGVARHAAFKVHRDSHSIHKQAAATSPPSSSSTNSSVSSSSPNAAASANSRRPPPAPAPRQTKPPPPPPQTQQPVIIYTHSPKVIRTNPRDFMSIVQKLTGLDSPGGPARGAAPPPAARVATVAAAAQDESSSSSSESCPANSHAAGPPPTPQPYVDSSQLMPPPAAPPLDAHFMAPDIPLFAPDASELHHLCAAPRGLYGQFPPPVDAAALGGPVMSANVHGGGGGNGGAVSFSPSMVEAMRAFPDYN